MFINLILKGHLLDTQDITKIVSFKIDDPSKIVITLHKHMMGDNWYAFDFGYNMTFSHTFKILLNNDDQATLFNHVIRDLIESHFIKHNNDKLYSEHNVPSLLLDMEDITKLIENVTDKFNISSYKYNIVNGVDNIKLAK